jgi:hypothetical protein
MIAGAAMMAVSKLLFPEQRSAKIILIAPALICP